MPTLFAEIALPSLLESSPVRMLAGVSAGVVLASILARVVRPRPGASASIVVAAFAANLLRIGVFGLATLVVAHFLWVLQDERSDFVGTAASVVFTILAAASAYIAGLFVARQFLAPPWWRLNAWDPNDHLRRDGFGIRAAAAWIVDDVRDLLGGLRLLDRIVVLGAIPLATIGAMQVFGVRETLIAVHGVLLVLYAALVVALFSANRIPRVLLTRLQDLRQVARRIAGGDLSARVGYLQTAEYEELGELVADFNSMARAAVARTGERGPDSAAQPRAPVRTGTRLARPAHAAPQSPVLPGGARGRALPVFANR